MTTICSGNQLFFGETVETWASLRAQAQARLGPVDGYLAQRNVFVVDDMRTALGVVAFGISNGAMDFGVVERNRLSPEVNARFAENGVRLVDAVNGSPPRRHPRSGRGSGGPCYRSHLRHHRSVKTDPPHRRHVKHLRSGPRSACQQLFYALSNRLLRVVPNGGAWPFCAGTGSYSR